MDELDRHIKKIKSLKQYGKFTHQVLGGNLIKQYKQDIKL